MKEMILRLPDELYERLVNEASAAQTSPEQWLLDRLSAESLSPKTIDASHDMLAAALDALGFRRLESNKAKQLNTLLGYRKVRELSGDEADKLQELMAEAEALELESLQRLTAVLQR